MSTHTIDAVMREEKGRKTNVIREEGKVPAVVYGAGTDSLPITLDRNTFIKTYKDAGESSLIALNIDGKEPLHVLIHDYQLDPVSDRVIHVDFRSVDVNEEIDAVVTLEFVGESAAVKALGGTFVPSRTSVTIRCLPTKLVRNIEVDISGLDTFEDSIKVGDLTVPDGVVILEGPELSIVSVSPPRKIEEPVVAEETEGEEGEEGAEKAEGEEGEKTEEGAEKAEESAEK